MTGYEGPVHALTQTPLGRAPDEPLSRDDLAVAVETPVDEATDEPDPDSVVVTESR